MLSQVGRDSDRRKASPLLFEAANGLALDPNAEACGFPAISVA